MKLKDMPKLESPFVRVLNEKNEYLVTPEIAEGYEWVFNDADVLATEKLDGTNVSVVIEDGQIKSVWNRTERIPVFNKGKAHIIKGVMESYERGYLDLLDDGQYFGELIGEKVNGNSLKIKGHLWIPFDTYAREHLTYKSWGKYPHDYETISGWFEKPIAGGGIFSLFMARTQSKDGVMYKASPEGVVFVKPSTGQMAKLRIDMFPHFKGVRHKEVPEATP